MHCEEKYNIIMKIKLSPRTSYVPFTKDSETQTRWIGSLEALQFRSYRRAKKVNCGLSGASHPIIDWV